jgi:hypothetical protein
MNIEVFGFDRYRLAKALLQWGKQLRIFLIIHRSGRD